MRKARALLLACALMLVGMACAQPEEDEPEASPTQAAAPSLEFGEYDDVLEDSNVLLLDVKVSGVEIKAADGDTSGESGHFHVFIDREPVEEGEVIPKERGIVHSAENPIRLWGLEPGEHEFTVVLGDGTHKRIHGDLEDTATSTIEGPSVWGTLESAAVEEGDDVELELHSEGVEIVAADNERSDESGHFHVLIDPATPPEVGKVIPPAEENKIIHSVEDSVTVSDLEKGEHTIWIVLGDGQHYAFDPPVMDKLTVTVS